MNLKATATTATECMHIIRTISVYLTGSYMDLMSSSSTTSFVNYLYGKAAYYRSYPYHQATSYSTQSSTMATSTVRFQGVDWEQEDARSERGTNDRKQRQRVRRENKKIGKGLLKLFKTNGECRVLDRISSLQNNNEWLLTDTNLQLKLLHRD